MDLCWENYKNATKYLNKYLYCIQNASKVGNTEDGSFEIQTLNEEYNCLGVQHLGHRQATKIFLKERIREKPQD